MTSKVIQDFLTKQIIIDKNIVTYRSLSRQQSLHVNDAKNELYVFLEQTRTQRRSVVATYLVSGEAREQHRGSLDENGMDVDEGWEFNDGDEDIPETRIILVGEDDLLGIKAQFLSIDAIYVYALSPSPIHDVDLLCGPADIVRNLDAQGGSKLAETVGKVLTEGIQEVKIKRGGKATELPPQRSIAGSSKEQTKEKIEPDKPAKQEPTKPTGKIDFSKAKAKSDKEKEKEKEKATAETKKSGEAKIKKEETLKHFESVSRKQDSNEKGSTEKVTSGTSPADIERQKTASGIKGKGPEKSVKGSKQKKVKTLLSESEDDSAIGVTSVNRSSARTSENKGKGSAKPVKTKEILSESGKESSSAKPNVRIKKRTILSDEEEDEIPVAKKSLTKFQRDAIPESDNELKVMMDVDDDQVIRASRPSMGTSTAGQDEEETPGPKLEREMDDDVTPIPKKPRKPKKMIPVGRNGLKKRRVTKSRMTTDAKGYMVTEDYSSYESVDEEEAQTSLPPKGKKGGKTKKEAEKEDPAGVPAVASKAPAKPIARSSSISGKAKGDVGKAGQQKGISHFFSKGK